MMDEKVAETLLDHEGRPITLGQNGIVGLEAGRGGSLECGIISFLDGARWTQGHSDLL